MKQYAITLLALFMAAGISATTIRYKNLDELVAEADGIVIGTVGGIESRYGPDGRIYTFVTLEQLEFIKGTYSQAALTLRLAGGGVNGRYQELIGSPKFKLQERVLVFVTGNGRYSVPFAGWTQGVFRLEETNAAATSVLDHDGNLVLGIEKADVVRERRYSPDVQIVRDVAVTQARLDASQSPPPPYSVDGRSTQGDQRKSTSPVIKQQAMRAQDFVDLLRKKVASGPHPGSASGGPAELRSVSDFEGVVAGEWLDAPAREVPPLSIPAEPAADGAVPGLAKP